jgi:membrane protease YdiL (CAAX protease family)
MTNRSGDGWWRLAAVTGVWGATFSALSAHGVQLLPLSVARQLTLEEYLSGVQLITLAVGLGLARALLHEPRRDLALLRPSLRALATIVAAAPAVFVMATTAAFLIARPVLLEELGRGGRELVQRSTGRFGRELTQAPPLLALAWGAVISPVSEELFFRGALWSLVEKWVLALPGRPSASADAALPADLLVDSGALRALGSIFDWLLQGGAATLAVTAVFGMLHHDMPGGLGLVRFVAALGLGLACGLARQHTGTVAAPALLHVAFNALSVAAARRWVVTPAFPMKNGAPTLVSLVGAFGLAFAVMLHLWSRRRR